MKLAVRKEEAAEMLSVSVPHFDRYIRPHLPSVESGSLRLFPVKGIDQYLDDHAESPASELERRRA